MNDAAFEAARAALVEARRRARAIAECPAAWRPADLREAYRLQAAVIDAFGPVGAWKVGAITAGQRQAMGIPAPAAGAIPVTFVQDASERPGRLRLAAFIAPLIECELAFELAGELPPRPAPGYSRDEVAAATAALRLAIELVDPRLARGSGALAEIADGFNNGAFIAGPRLRDWRGLDFASTGIVLTIVSPGGRPAELARGSGRAILEGDPFAAVVLLANAQPPGRGLRAGDIVTTGSCTGAPRLPGPGRYRAEFEGLGSAELQLDA
jgi:2-keto-4-pentenoate hydratase